MADSYRPWCDRDPKFLGIENALINEISLRNFSFQQSTFRYPS
ncbi:hypothetical protein MYAER_3275 [Microcystis aeruginosa NIES-2549]|uniref:Uncharacterized protein n=1 Tax=Microcystis aeruginosa NIES-2549 TaxID=1641812 RepID=A0A0F6RMW1_MICAE|nr:hypothetical protein MYAER_3275 [Microcystis aeruginosa NIES-2549]AOC54026.1 hypothetical protein amyaer_3321 [Microcystis aeruginosa NIES-2481]